MQVCGYWFCFWSPFVLLKRLVCASVHSETITSVYIDGINVSVFMATNWKMSRYYTIIADNWLLTLFHLRHVLSFLGHSSQLFHFLDQSLECRFTLLFLLDVGRWTLDVGRGPALPLPCVFYPSNSFSSHYYNNAFLICESRRPAHNLTLDKHGMEFTNTAPFSAAI